MYWNRFNLIFPNSPNFRFPVIKALFIVLIFGIQGCYERPSTTETTPSNKVYSKIPETVDFTFHVKPIISDRCFKCHGPDKNAVEGGLSLNTPEDAYMAIGKNKDHFAIVPGDAKKSVLVDRIYSNDPGLQMPPPESNLFLSDYEKEILKKWIVQGAEYKTHWSFIPPAKQKVPKTENISWSTNELDHFILAKLKEQGLSPSKLASKEKLLRRVSFDLTGLPPSQEQLYTFLNDNSPKSYETAIDSLLKSPDYAEYMASEWMDISRYADTHGYQNDFERTMWPWRDWVIHAFDKNMPYDEFVTYQLAGDLLPNANKEQILATGFNRNHKITGEVGVILEEYRVEYVEDRTNTFSTAFLGLTMECARCHDHKYDPISQEEHFEMFSFFNNVDEKVLMADPTVVPEPHLMLSEKETKGILSFINLQKSPVKEIPMMVMAEMEEPRNTFILNRGVYDQPTTQVYPTTPESILAFSDDYPKNRLGLAKWLFDEKNPLAARVAVNRLWQRMFGTGLVSSPFDFGNQGALPTHPELLDFLALKYREEGWNTKKMLKYIALSSTYRQTAAVSQEILSQDPENKYLSHAPRLRLSSESIRDQALKISGLLNSQVGGPSVKPYQPSGIWEETTGGGGGSTARYEQGTGADLYRKSLYTFWKRTVPPPSMITFDASSRDHCTVKRQETNTPLQALVLMNDPQMIEASRVLAIKAMKLDTDDVDNQIGYIFTSATSRKPDEKEALVLKTYYEEMLEKVRSGEIKASEYLSIGDYQNPIDLGEEKLTALSLTAHTILNLDETITRG